MEQISIFKMNSQEIHTFQINDEPWFSVADICAYFGVTNRNRVMQQIDDDEKGGTQMTTPGGKQTVSIVSESGLYSLLFALQPEKARGVTDQYIRERTDKLKQFRRWITHEVIPSIRKTGGYIAGQETMSADELMAKALLVAQKTLSELTVQNTIMAPKADYFDELVDRNTLTNFRETAKQLELPPKQFVSFLLDHKYVYRDKRGKLLPYEEKNAGLFEVKECVNDKTKWSGTQTLVTPRGRETFRLLCQ
jgi:phage antirepressor YoqD-like protein